jgi:hypothetical protein
VAGAIHIEEHLRQVHGAAARGAQLDQRQRVHLQETNVFGQLVLAQVVFMIGHLHALEVEVEPLAGQQAFLAREIAELQVGQARIAQLVLQGPLGLLGDVEGELEALGIEPAHLALHPGVKGLVGLLASLFRTVFVEETLDLLGVSHLLAVALEFLLGDGLADLGRADLLEDLVDLAGGQVALEGPFLLAAGIIPDSRRLASLISLLPR